MYLLYLLVQNILKGCSNLSTEVLLDINSFENLALEEINSEFELKEFMITGFLEVEEIFSQFELKLESLGLSPFSNKPGLEIEAIN